MKKWKSNNGKCPSCKLALKKNDEKAAPSDLKQQLEKLAIRCGYYDCEAIVCPEKFESHRKIEHPQSLEKPMEIFLKFLTGSLIPLKVFPSDSIWSVKKKVEEKQKIPIKEQRIIFNNKQLENRNILADYNVKDQHTLDIVLRLYGGD